MRVQLAVIGAGLIGRKHIALAYENEHCDLAAICDASPAAVEVAAQYGVSFYRDVGAMLDAQQIDGAIIATPTNLHTPIGVACAERGVHLLVEKPIAGTVTEGQRLVDSAEKHNVHLLVGHHRRHNPLVQKARAVVQSGVIGDLVGVMATFALLKPDDYFNVTWRREVGGGPVLTNLIHDIDNLRFICGEIASVFAATSSTVRGFAVEETASVTLRFANGALGSAFVSDATPAPWSYEMTSGENPIYPQQTADCYRFLGTKGSLAFPSLKLWTYDEPGRDGWWDALLEKETNENIAPADALTEQLNHFCAVIRREAEPLITGTDGVRTLAATQAVIESGQTHQPISLLKQPS